MRKTPVFVTQPALPPLDEYLEYLKNIWESKILTNNGPYHQEFEKALCNYLGVDYISVFSNGTLALVTALQALGIKGEVITTPFSFVATAHALWWNNIKPIFVDVEPKHFTLDPKRIEEAITPDTTAILPVHVYGYPCNMQELKKISDKYGLKVIYDAAHAFGVKIDGESILKSGDLSILSFHATKAFNTIEGGAIISPDEKTKRKIDFLKNFGFADEVTVIEPGINAKMNELQAAFGLLQLKYIDTYLARRKAISEKYREKLEGINGLRFFDDVPGVSHSYTYFPVFVDEVAYGESRDNVYERLKEANIFGRRYFYPLITSFSPYRDLDSANPKNLPVAIKVSKQVICLPIFPELQNETIIEIVALLRK